MRNLTLFVILIMATGLYTVYADKATAPTPPAAVKQLSAHALHPAPDFTFKSLKGKTHKLSDFKGKAVVINFWASWCAPCVIEFPQMIRLAQAAKEESIFLFLSWDENDKDIQAFLKKYSGKNLPSNVIVARDTGKKIGQDLFQTYRLPETYLVAHDGMVTDKFIGADIVWDTPEMVEKIRILGRRHP